MMIGLLMTPEKLPSRFSCEERDMEPDRPASMLHHTRLTSPQRLAAAMRQHLHARRAARRASSPAAW